MGGVGLAELFGPSVELFDGPQFGIPFVRNLVEKGRNLMENVRNSIFYQLLRRIYYHLALTGQDAREGDLYASLLKSKGLAASQQLFYYIRPPLA